MPPDKLGPDEWLCAAVDHINRNNPREPFKVVKIEREPATRDREIKVIHVLHRDSGALWAFRCSVLREPVG
jgi:hypothetical protein